MRQALFSGEFTVVVTSATLAVRGSLDYFQQRIGAEAATSLTLSSPFDFARQVQLYVPSGMPTPKNAELFFPAAAGKIRHFIDMTQGKAFVLFTSYVMMQEMAVELEGFFRERGISLMVQGEGIPRTAMLERFREDVDSVIFGTASFWTGVDVPGEALRNVIIVRLPFSVPDHPLVAARQELIERRGGNSFYDYSLPEAILRFRQGCGRLIRSRDDSGIIVVLDGRILSTRYGRAFLESLPQCPVNTDC
jgi:ATP-dependent DNA helicase DinG